MWLFMHGEWLTTRDCVPPQQAADAQHVSPKYLIVGMNPRAACWRSSSSVVTGISIHMRSLYPN